MSSRRRFLGQLLKGAAALPFVGTLKGSREIIDAVENPIVRLGPDTTYNARYKYANNQYSLGFKISPEMANVFRELHPDLDKLKSDRISTFAHELYLNA